MPMPDAAASLARWQGEMEARMTESERKHVLVNGYVDRLGLEVASLRVEQARTATRVAVYSSLAAAMGSLLGGAVIFAWTGAAA